MFQNFNKNRFSQQARIIGGSIAQPNEFVSMAALVDITEKNNPEGPIFCGAAISENKSLITLNNVKKVLILSFSK